MADLATSLAPLALVLGGNAKVARVDVDSQVQPWPISYTPGAAGGAAGAGFDWLNFTRPSITVTLDTGQVIGPIQPGGPPQQNFLAYAAAALSGLGAILAGIFLPFGGFVAKILWGLAAVFGAFGLLKGSGPLGNSAT